MSDFPIVQIKNLSYTTTNKQIFEFFSQYGSIYQLRKNSNQQGIIYIIYYNFKSAQLAARETNGVNFNGRYLISSLFHVDKSKLGDDEFKLRKEQLDELKKMYEIE